MFGVGVHDVGVERGAEDLHAERQQGGADVDDEPVEAVLRGPAVDQEPHRGEEGARQQQRDAQLRHVGLAGARRQPRVGIVHERPAELRARHLAGADCDVVQAGGGDGLAVRRHVQGREARQRKVQQAVVEARQDGLDLDDGVEREQAYGPREAAADFPRGGAAGLAHLDLGVEAGVARLCAQPLGPPAEEDGRVALTEHEK